MAASHSRASMLAGSAMSTARSSLAARARSPTRAARCPRRKRSAATTLASPRGPGSPLSPRVTKSGINPSLSLLDTPAPRIPKLSRPRGGESSGGRHEARGCGRIEGIPWSPWPRIGRRGESQRAQAPWGPTLMIGQVGHFCKGGSLCIVRGFSRTLTIKGPCPIMEARDDSPVPDEERSTAATWACVRCPRVIPLPRDEILPTARLWRP